MSAPGGDDRELVADLSDDPEKRHDSLPPEKFWLPEIADTKKKARPIGRAFCSHRVSIDAGLLVVSISVFARGVYL
jgi:hypothetical protein